MGIYEARGRVIMIIIPKSKKELAADAGACVYFLYLNDEVVYVGQSANLVVRLSGHSKQREFDSFSFITTEISELNNIEALSIVEHKPTGNKTLPINDYYASHSKIASQVRDTVMDKITEYSESLFVGMAPNKKKIRYVDNDLCRQFIKHIHNFEYIAIGEE